MAGEYQKELFEEFKKEKGKFKKIADDIAQRRKKIYIHMPLENAIVAIIITIMALVVAFALGVERGKRFSMPLVQKKSVSAEKKISIAQIKPKPTETSAPVEAKKKSQDRVEKEINLPYTIQLVSYTEKRFAEDEKKKLLNKKIEASIIPSGRWYQVCAGRYGDINEAKKALEEFQKDYKGCFIRRR